MNWQQIASLVIVATTLFLLVRWFVRKVKEVALGICAKDCGCTVNELLKKIPEEQLKRLRGEQHRVTVERHTI